MKSKNILIIILIVLILTTILIVGFIFLNKQELPNNEKEISNNNQENINNDNQEASNGNDKLIQAMQSTFVSDVVDLKDAISMDYVKQVIENKNTDMDYFPTSEIKLEKEELENKYFVTCDIDKEGLIKITTSSDTPTYIIDLKPSYNWLK